MLRILLSFSAALAACAPSPQKAAMPDPGPIPATDARGSGETQPGDPAPPVPRSTSRATGPEQAAREPISPASTAEHPLPARRADSPEEAEGRRTLSTAFVRVGPDGHLTVELRDGHALVLRDVTMGPRDYCGTRASAGSSKLRYCGGYADVAAARPGGGPVPGEPGTATDGPIEPTHGPSDRR